MPHPRRKHDREFKIEAVKLVTRGDKSQAHVARDLGISVNQLAHWKQISTPILKTPSRKRLSEACRRRNAKAEEKKQTAWKYLPAQTA